VREVHHGHGAGNALGDLEYLLQVAEQVLLPVDLDAQAVRVLLPPVVVADLADHDHGPVDGLLPREVPVEADMGHDQLGAHGIGDLAAPFQVLYAARGALVVPQEVHVVWRVNGYEYVELLAGLLDQLAVGDGFADPPQELELDRLQFQFLDVVERVEPCPSLARQRYTVGSETQHMCPPS